MVLFWTGDGRCIEEVAAAARTPEPFFDKALSTNDVVAPAAIAPRRGSKNGMKPPAQCLRLYSNS